jgi:peptidoglycan/LPS O-acetylase OafA/YrhL
VDRRGRALVALMLFVALTGAAIVVSGSRPASDPGAAPWVLQVIGYLCALAGGVLLRAPAAGADPDDRRTGLIVLVALGALVLIDAVTAATDSGGANIGAGFLRLICLVALFVATARLAVAVAKTRRAH